MKMSYLLSHCFYRKLKLLTRSVIFLNIILLPIELKAQLAEGHSKFLGNIIGYNIPEDFDIYWNQITPENSGKWGEVERSRDNMQWGSLDLIYDYAKDMDFPFRLHVLIWGNQQPGWIESLPASEQLEEIEEWFITVAERYPDIDYLEVVNEPLHDPPNQPGNGGGNYIEALGGSNDLYGTGWDWVIKSFELAREYFPASTKLMINDFGIVNDVSATTNYLNIINLLIERELIDGIGVQGHAFSTRGSMITITNNLNRLAETGLPIQVCELDIDGPSDQVQLDDYQEIFPTFWEHPGVKGITLWGYKEGMIWRTEAFLVRSDGTERPALEWLWEYMEETAVTIDAQSQPTDFNLCQNYPNPFNPETEISYQLPKGGQVRLEIYDILGHKIKTLVNNNLSVGFYNIHWNALDESGKRVPNGVYLYQIKVTDSDNIFTKSKKMLLLK